MWTRLINNLVYCLIGEDELDLFRVVHTIGCGLFCYYFYQSLQCNPPKLCPLEYCFEITRVPGGYLCIECKNPPKTDIFGTQLFVRKGIYDITVHPVEEDSDVEVMFKKYFVTDKRHPECIRMYNEYEARKKAKGIKSTVSLKKFYYTDSRMYAPGKRYVRETDKYLHNYGIPGKYRKEAFKDWFKPTFGFVDLTKPDYLARPDFSLVDFDFSILFPPEVKKTYPADRYFS